MGWLSTSTSGSKLYLCFGIRVFCTNMSTFVLVCISICDTEKAVFWLVARFGGFSSAGDDNKKQRYDGDKDDDADINNVTIMT